MEKTFYPSLEESLELHRTLIDKFGGKPGVRDLGLLESALSRPRSGYYTTLSTQAAALLQSFIMNHAFYDGNKRVAFAIMAIFLHINGYKLKVSTKKAQAFLIENVIKNKAELKEISTWLEKHMIKI